MITIPSPLKGKLVDLDRNLHELGRNLYGRKIFQDYAEGDQFYNFHVELHSEGSFTIHFHHGILGHIETKNFGVQDEEVLQELELLNTLVKNKLKLVST